MSACYLGKINRTTFYFKLYNFLDGQVLLMTIFRGTGIELSLYTCEDGNYEWLTRVMQNHK